MVFLQGPVYAQEVELRNIFIASTDGYLSVHLELESAFSKKMEEAILNGVPVTFSFFIILDQVRNFWIDEELVDMEVTHVMKYNNFKKEFIITRSWKEDEQLATQSFEQAQKLMIKINNLKIVELGQLENGKRYQLGVKAKLRKMELKPILQYLFFFFPLWDFETDWYLIDFTY
jgi:hypothetical protein